MQYFKFIIFTCLFLVFSCAKLPKVTDFHQSESNFFSVDETALDQGVLRIYLPEKKPKSLAIKTPNDEWFVLQDSEESIEVIPQKHFESTTKMEFQVSSLRGIVWRESKKITELVFKRSGSYLIYFADNLETEPENTYSFQKVIHYQRKY